ncbi:hypothetical protein Nepgr_010396 [Nepenthes gracilis]|uniref:Uncharacterized protein n=1 Tax=Nepenthes gracilis TaxID=150966 RepID=A0AAD3SD29_NEPGR|nr:hypothetical protein Nepgr_010396 [Nepenthes gracilis]
MGNVKLVLQALCNRTGIPWMGAAPLVSEASSSRRGRRRTATPGGVQNRVQSGVESYPSWDDRRESPEQRNPRNSCGQRRPTAANSNSERPPVRKAVTIDKSSRTLRTTQSSATLSTCGEGHPTRRWRRRSGYCEITCTRRDPHNPPPTFKGHPSPWTCALSHYPANLRCSSREGYDRARTRWTISTVFAPICTYREQARL